MANSTVSRDYLNLIERALMMGISDNLNKQIKTWDISSYPLTAAKLNAMTQKEIPYYMRSHQYANEKDAYGGWMKYGDGGTSTMKLAMKYGTTFINSGADFANGDTFLLLGDSNYFDVNKARVYEAKTSGADIAKNEFNIGSTQKETLENIKAALFHINGHRPEVKIDGVGSGSRQGYTVSLKEFPFIYGTGPPNYVDKTSYELVFEDAYHDSSYEENPGDDILIDIQGVENQFGGSSGSMPSGSNWVTVGTTLNMTLSSTTPRVGEDTILTVADSSAFLNKGSFMVMIDKETMSFSGKTADVDESANTVKLRRPSTSYHDVSVFAHTSGATILYLNKYSRYDGKQLVRLMFLGTNRNNFQVRNHPPKGDFLEQTEYGFHVYGAFPESSQIQFPAIVVQQVASGFEEKFFGDTVTFGSDTTTSSGEVYGMTFLIHIFTDEKTVIPFGSNARYGQRRLTNWMMMNIANVIQGLDWAVYQEQELEVIERHLNQWRDIGYMPQAGWYGATAEFDIFFLNKR